MEENYQTTVVPVNCEQLRREDVLKILESVLYEFPIERVEFLSRNGRKCSPLIIR